MRGSTPVNLSKSLPDRLILLASVTLTVILASAATSARGQQATPLACGVWSPESFSEGLLEEQFASEQSALDIEGVEVVDDDISAGIDLGTISGQILLCEDSGLELLFVLPWQPRWEFLGSSQLLILVSKPDVQRLEWGVRGQNRGSFLLDGDPITETEFFSLIAYSNDPDAPFGYPPFTLDCDQVVWDVNRYRPNNLADTEPALGIDLACNVILGRIVFHFDEVAVDEQRYCEFLDPPLTVYTRYNGLDEARAEATGNEQAGSIPGFSKDPFLDDPNLRVAYDKMHLLWSVLGSQLTEDDSVGGKVRLWYFCLNPDDPPSYGHN